MTTTSEDKVTTTDAIAGQSGHFRIGHWQNVQAIENLVRLAPKFENASDYRPQVFATETIKTRRFEVNSFCFMPTNDHLEDQL